MINNTNANSKAEDCLESIYCYMNSSNKAHLFLSNRLLRACTRLATNRAYSVNVKNTHKQVTQRDRRIMGRTIEEPEARDGRRGKGQGRAEERRRSARNSRIVKDY